MAAKKFLKNSPKFGDRKFFGEGPGIRSPKGRSKVLKRPALNESSSSDVMTHVLANISKSDYSTTPATNKIVEKKPVKIRKVPTNSQIAHDPTLKSAKPDLQSQSDQSKSNPHANSA